MSATNEASDASSTPPSALVALPGTGSDADYVRRAFSPVAHALGIELIAVDPAPDGIESGYRRALDDAARDHDRLLVAGVSIGACVALDWAVDHDRCAGVMAALPPWLDTAGDAPATRSAQATAEAIDRLGLPGAIDAMVASSPTWLGAELARSWSSIGAPLRRHLDEAAALRIPRAERIAALAVPLAITAAVDDPIHPVEIARRWADLAEFGVLHTVTVAQWGADAASLGRHCLQGWREMTGSNPVRGTAQRP